MSTGTPTKPAGCFLQCCAIVPLLLMLGAFGTGQITLGILLFAAGIGLLWWGGLASRKEDTWPCPFCKEPVKAGAIICPHCRKEFTQKS